MLLRTPLRPKIAGQFRVLVTGSRTWDDTHTLESILNAAKWYAHKEGLKLVVIHGAHKPRKQEIRPGVWDYPEESVDWLTHLWCKKNGVEEDPHPAKWTKHGNEAGKIRNRFMVEERNADICVSAMRGLTFGTAHCTRLAKKAGIPIVPITQEAEVKALG